MPPIRPKQTGLTPEAAEALNLHPSLNGDVDSADSELDTDPWFQTTEPSIGSPLVGEDGDSIPAADDINADGEEAHGSGASRPRSRLRSAARTSPARDSAKATPPSIDEWMHFFSNVVLRVLCDWYVGYAFRGIDEELLTEREVDRLRMTDEERNRIAIPFAELSHKSKTMRKHGRMIVASGGAMDAVVAFGVWTSRVNRIARKYKPRTHGNVRVTGERTGPATPNGDFTQGANGGRIGDGFTIINPGS